MSFGRKEGDRKGSGGGSVWSGISPGQSRRPSFQSVRQAHGQSGLSRVNSRSEAAGVARIEE